MKGSFTAARLEGYVQVTILVAVGLMAGAASFRHVHDWTMRYSPPGTASWFGWANAMVTELIPTASGLEARRRKRTSGKVGAYPILLILGALGFSLLGQFAEAEHSIFGWIVAAIPAIGFVALVKLVLSRPSPVARPSGPSAATPDDIIVQAPAAVSDELVAPERAVVPARANGHAIGSGIIR